MVIHGTALGLTSSDAAGSIFGKKLSPSVGYVGRVSFFIPRTNIGQSISA